MNISLTLNTRAHRIAVSVFFFIAGLTVSSWASRIPDIKTALQLNDAALGSVLFALPAGQIISLPISGWLISKFGSRQSLMYASIFFPLTLVLLALAATTWQLIILLFFFGFWGNLLNISMNTQAVAIESLYGRSIMASFHGLWSLAGFCGAAIGNLFVSNSISPLIHFASIGFIISILITGFYRHTLSTSSNVSTAKQKIFVRPDKFVLVLGFIAFCCMICEGSMADWSGVYFQNIIHAPLQYITLGYVSFMATMATGRFLGDWLITKFGTTKILQFSGILIASGLLIMIFFPYLQTAITGCLFVGVGVSCVVPMVYAMAGRSKTMSPEFALATISTIGFLGFLLGPPVIGFIAQFSSLRWSFGLIAALGFGTTLLASRFKSITE